MTDRKQKINTVFTKLFESLMEAQRLVNVDDKPSELELTTRDNETRQEQSVRVKLRNTLQDVLGSDEEE
jgi:GTP cyclohydrolase II|tara:strand:- start:470 stop:676 length:207 start_codon:yes stop_codon:yes gene_type:complete